MLRLRGIHGVWIGTPVILGVVALRAACLAAEAGPPGSAPAVGAAPADLAALLAEAEAHSPGILAASSRLGSAERVPSQAASLPDPEVSLGYTNVGFTRLTLGDDSDAGLTLRWRQELPDPGKRRLAGDVARAEIETSRRTLSAKRLHVRAAVEQAYAELYRIDRSAEILRENRTLLDGLLQSARSRYESGEGILENILKAQTELAEIEARGVLLQEERAGWEADLVGLLGRTTQDSIGPVMVLPPSRVPPPEEMERLLLERSADLLVLRAMRDSERRRLDLARRAQRSDFLWSAAYENRGGLDPMIMGEIGVRLPLYRARKQTQAVLQAELDLGASEYEVQAGETGARAELARVMARITRAASLVRLYGEAIVPQARSAFESAAASYASGKAPFATVVDDFLAALDGQIALAAQEADRVKSIAALEPLLGEDLVLPAAGSAPVPPRGDSDD